ncbi:MAG TPA: carbohydrate kinase family protein, partial [Blastocatellia bacterium]|nr:carbohydrate kinase family protein [Blastocatellia bacterium]
MEFGIEIPEGKPFDAVALGLNAVDHLVVVPHYPDFNTKIAFLSHTIAPGGQSATAMVTLARLGLRARYIGRVGGDEPGRLQIESLVKEGVDATSVRVIEQAETQTAFIIIE